MNEFPSGLIAVVRASTEESCRFIANGLIAGGVSQIELTTTTPGYRSVVASLSDASQLQVGVGTVLTVEQVEAAVDDGASYIVSPDLDQRVVHRASELGLPSAAGALTPTEVRRAYDAGATVVKIFPVGSLGGVSYIKDLRGPLPHVPLIVSGGIQAHQTNEYLEAGVQAVCVGGALVSSSAVSTGDSDALVDHVQGVLRQLHGD